MNYKKIFTGIMTVALIATICVGFASCSKDKDAPPVIDTGGAIKNKRWSNIINDNGHFDMRYGLEFKFDDTYSYITPDRNIAGNYRVFESQKSNEVISYTGVDGNEYEHEFDYILYKILVSGSSDFDQIWVYYDQKKYNWIVVHFYFNNELLVYKPTFTIPF